MTLLVFWTKNLVAEVKGWTIRVVSHNLKSDIDINANIREGNTIKAKENDEVTQDLCYNRNICRPKGRIK